MKFIDVGCNLTDPMFRGIYNDKQAHESDFDAVLDRAHGAGVEKIIVTGGFFTECKEAVQMTATPDPAVPLYCTVGVHPTRCQEFETFEGAPTTLEDHIGRLKALIAANRDRVVAIGECGLDYDRLHFCPKDAQIRGFEAQFGLAEETGLPMFLHNRNAGDDFADVVSRNRDRYSRAIAHCFTGTAEELSKLLELDLYIGVTGCSLKTAENVHVMQQIPDDRLIIETDAPWCDIRPTHAGFKHVQTTWPSTKKERFVRGQCVKNRTEPCHIWQVLEVVAAFRGSDVETLGAQLYDNAARLFFSSKS